MMAKVI